MNNRIKELADECWDNGYGMGKVFDTNKFAELIIKQCAELMYGRDTDGNCKDGDTIKEYFGVE